MSITIPIDTLNFVYHDRIIELLVMSETEDEK
jgi:hypothetical protein